MNIRTDQVEALLRQQEQAAKKTTPANSADFGAILASKMDSAPGVGAERPTPGAELRSAIVGRMLLADAEKISGSADAEEEATRQTLERASKALDTWDSYIDVLGKPGVGGLRKAYGLLEGLDAQVAALKQGAEPMLGKRPEVDGLISELEIMAVTEKFKFNRGDYS